MHVTTTMGPGRQERRSRVGVIVQDVLSTPRHTVGVIVTLTVADATMMGTAMVELLPAGRIVVEDLVGKRLAARLSGRRAALGQGVVDTRGTTGVDVQGGRVATPVKLPHLPNSASGPRIGRDEKDEHVGRCATCKVTGLALGETVRKMEGPRDTCRQAACPREPAPANNAAGQHHGDPGRCNDRVITNTTPSNLIKDEPRGMIGTGATPPGIGTSTKWITTTVALGPEMQPLAQQRHSTHQVPRRAHAPGNIIPSTKENNECRNQAFTKTTVVTRLPVGAPPPRVQALRMANGRRSSAGESDEVVHRAIANRPCTPRPRTPLHPEIAQGVQGLGSRDSAELGEAVLDEPTTATDGEEGPGTQELGVPRAQTNVVSCAHGHDAGGMRVSDKQETARN